VERDSTPSHAPDFSSIMWFGKRFSFSPKQRSVVELLWDAFQTQLPGLSHAFLVEKAGLQGTLRDTFKIKGTKFHAAWGTMIVREGGKDMYRLRPPVEPIPRVVTTTKKNGPRVSPPKPR
jgi:hypothetical protein